MPTIEVASPLLYTRILRYNKISVDVDPFWSQQIVPATIERVSLILWTAMGGWIAPWSNVTDMDGIFLDNAKSPLIVSFRDWGTIVGEAWYAYNPNSAPLNIRGYELLMYRRGG